MLAEVASPVKSDMVLSLEKSALLKSLENEERAEYTDIWKGIGDGGQSPHASLDTALWTPAIHTFMVEREKVEKKYIALRKSGLSQLEQDHENKKRRQSSIAIAISRFSPLSCFIYAMSTLARTGLIEESIFKEDANRFEGEMQRNIYDKIFTIKFSNSTSSTWDFAVDDPPQFQSTSLPLSGILKYAWLDVLLLCLYNILFFSCAYVAFIKYDIR